MLLEPSLNRISLDLGPGTLTIGEIMDEGVVYPRLRKASGGPLWGIGT
jgi:hypothetical protein